MVSLQRFHCRDRRHEKTITYTLRTSSSFCSSKVNKYRELQTRQKRHISASSPSVTSKLSRKSSSSLMRARASWKERECVLCHKANPINYIHIKHQESNAVTAIRKQTYFHLESQNKRSDKICRPRERADVLCVFTRLKKKSTLHTRTDTNWTVGFIMKSRIDIASMRQGNLL